MRTQYGTQGCMHQVSNAVVNGDVFSAGGIHRCCYFTAHVICNRFSNVNDQVVLFLVSMMVTGSPVDG